MKRKENNTHFIKSIQVPVNTKKKVLNRQLQKTSK